MSYKSRVPKQLESFMKVITDSSYRDNHYTLSKKLGLRASGLPFCPLKFILSLPKLFAGEETATGSAFFFRVGTTVHEVVQKGVEIAVKELEQDAGMIPIADWKCLHCGHLHTFIPRPDECEFCKHHQFEMLEHTVRYRQLTGHIDNVFLMQPQNKYLIVDYKTATVKKVEGKEEAVFGNVQQIGTYVAIKHSDGYKMLGWALIYIARNSLWSWYPVLEEDPDNEGFLRRLNKFCDLHEELLTAESLGDKEWGLALDNRVCKTKKQVEERGGYCAFKDICSAHCNGDSAPLEMQRKHVVRFISNKLPLAQWLELDDKVGYAKIK